MFNASDGIYAVMPLCFIVLYQIKNKMARYNGMKRLFLLFTLLYTAAGLYGQNWLQDTLGGDFEVRFFDQGSDYSGPVRSSLVRLKQNNPTGEAVLYLHGFNDYFFQKEMAEQFVGHGYGFYAVDLRKYGRSFTAGQKRCQVRNFNEYFADIDSAFQVIMQEGYDRVILFGHSTGGLVAAYYMAHYPNAPVSALLLNSPFLDWNLGKMERFVGAVSFAGRLFPNISVRSGSGRAYGESLSRRHHGEWSFDTIWKSIDPTKVDFGWIRAVNSAQRYLKKHSYSINVPILLMYSAKSIDAVDWNPEVNTADAVLDVDDIRKYGLSLGHDVTPVSVVGGMHDLLLSDKSVREPLYEYIFSWLQNIRQY